MKIILSEYLKRSLSATVFILFVSWGISSAQPSSQEQKDDIETQRIGFITKQLDLTSQEAQVFWPVYNKYRAELDVMRKSRATELMTARINFDNYTDDQINKLIENEFSYRQKELDLSRKYNEEFKKVLPLKKVAQLYRSEQLFKINLIKETRQDKSGNAGQKPPPEKGAPPPNK